jgi:hypothetical protein
LNQFKRHAAFAREHVDDKISALIGVSGLNVAEKSAGDYRPFGRASQLEQVENVG